MNRGYDGGFLILDVSRSKYFIQLRKYIKAPGNYGIELCFPKANWSAKYYEDLINLCIQDRIEYLIAKENTNDSLEFLYIDFGRDIHKAQKYVKKIVTQLFCLNENIKLFARLEKATVEDKLIDSQNVD